MLEPFIPLYARGFCVRVYYARICGHCVLETERIKKTNVNDQREPATAFFSVSLSLSSVHTRSCKKVVQ